MKRYSNLFFLLVILIVTIFMILNPRETVQAAAAGFKLWFSILVPSLLPFLIVADLLVNLGFVSLLGVLLEPVMRPFFKLPGCSSLVVAMGFTCGFPVGAILTRKLYEDRMLTAEEAERLVSFTNNSSPLFIIGAVGVGMFSSPQAGYLLAISHYLSNFLVGIIWSWHNKSKSTIKHSHDMLSEAWHALCHIAAKTDGIGKMMGDAIKNGLNNIMAIAGFVIIFSVLTRMFTVWGLMDGVASLLCRVLAIFKLPHDLIMAMCMGIFEITLGSKAVSLTPQGSLLVKLSVVSLILAFSGFSIIAQIMSVMAGTPVRFLHYLGSRLLQMLLSVSITYMGFNIFIKSEPGIPSFSLPYYKVLYSFDAWRISIYGLLIILAGLIIISAINAVIYKLKIYQ